MYSHGAIVRGDSTQKKIALVFTGHEFADGGFYIGDILKKGNINASFFFTGDFYRNPAFKNIIRSLRVDGNYLGAHSDKHLLYCDWNKRDSLLVTKDEFEKDLQRNYATMSTFGISQEEAKYFMPPYEWYNDSIAEWTSRMRKKLINFTAGTLSNADYTTPDMKNYRSSDTIFQSILQYEQNKKNGLNGFILLLHIGTDKKRTDKMYYRLPELISYLKRKQYSLARIDELLK